MLRLAILSIILAFVKAQADPYEACVGLEDTTLVGFGHDVSCTKYYYCEGEIGYEEDCADLYGAEFEFSEETGACDYSDVVNCAAYGPVDPEPIVTDPPVVTQPPPPPVTQPPPPPVTDTPIVVDPNIPDITCPTNRPGEIIFFESSNCTEYFICANGIRMQMFCLEGFAWNQIDKQCDYPIFSRCAVIFFIVNIFRFDSKVFFLLFLAKHC